MKNLDNDEEIIVCHPPPRDSASSNNTTLEEKILDALAQVEESKAEHNSLMEKKRVLE